MNANRVDTVVIGGGQAGLTTGYYLARNGQSFVILDENERVGDAWRKRWDSLRLFTPAAFSSLPGLPLQHSRWEFATKDEMADYLESYARHFELPVKTGVAVESVSKLDGRFVVSTDETRYEAENVVVATGAHRIPKTPAFAPELDPAIVQLHSCEYRNPSQLQDGAVLLVGAGNSGAEIAYELAQSRSTTLAGENNGQIPVAHGTLRARPFFRLIRFLGHRVLTHATPIGRKVGPKLAAKGDPLIRRRERELAAAGVERVPRVAGVEDGRPVLEDGRVVDVANVIWCTGFRAEYGWIDLLAFDDEGQPRHHRGVVESEPGLYFMGLVFQYSVTSDVLPGAGRDAEYIAGDIAKRQRELAPTREPVFAAA